MDTHINLASESERIVVPALVFEGELKRFLMTVTFSVLDPTSTRNNFNQDNAANIMNFGQVFTKTLSPGMRH